MHIAVIGGGVTGASVAYFLGKLGGDDTDVTVYESGHIAGDRGSTAYSAGLVRHTYSTALQVKIARRGSEFLYNLEEHTGEDGGVHKNGYLKLVNEDAEASVRRMASFVEDVGIDVDLIEPERLESVFPGIDTTNVSLGMLDTEAGFADPYLVTNALMNRARELGVEIHTKTPVEDIGVENGAVSAVESSRGTDEVDVVVNAAGPWGAEVGAMVGLDLPLKLFESKLVALESDTPYKLSYPSVSDVAVRPDIYTKPEPGNEFIVGGIERPPVDPDVGLEGVNNEYLDKLLDRIELRFPEFADARIIDSWSGLVTMTPDSHHIAGEADTVDNFFNIVGASGHGFKEAPAFGESIAQEILGHEPRFDLTPYRFERFEEDDRIEQDKALFGDHHEDD